jgi:integrase
MISHLGVEWHRRAAAIMRFTGLRASQACGLTWRDIDLERGVLRVRARQRGAKRSRARVLPVHSSLVEAMRSWGPGGGVLFPRRYRGADRMPRLGHYRGDALVEPFRRAWHLAGVAPEKWNIPESVEFVDKHAHAGMCLEEGHHPVELGASPCLRGV